MQDIFRRTSMSRSLDADILIVGAGVSGLYAAVELQKKYPEKRIVVCEKYKYLGGRTYTYKGDYQWEAGAGRIAADHDHLHALLKRYGLREQLISPAITYKRDGANPIEPTHFEETIPLMLAPLARLPPTILATHTIRQLLTRIHGAADTRAYLNRFPYRAEVDTMRADMGLKSFLGEMGSHEGYSVVEKGFSSLIDALRADFVKRGGVVRNRHELFDVAEDSGTVYASFRVGPPAEGDARHTKVMRAGRIILALHAEALRALPSFADWDVLRHLRMEPLLRTYAVFPTPGGHPWFDGLARVVSDTPIRYFLPIDPGRGIAMVSYTDSTDTKGLLDMKEDALERFIVAELRKLFPDRRIPRPTFFKAHPWKYGCTYWLPGDYSPAAASAAAYQPFGAAAPHIHVCGESFSLRQAWVEGALEHTDGLIHFIVNKK